MESVKVDNLSKEVQVAAAIAREAGAAIMRYHREGGYAVEQKADDSPVTAADKAANEIILRGLREYFSYPVLSEESPDDLARLASDTVWIVDPLDGTRGFIKGADTFGVLIGLARDGAPVAGVVCMPARDELYLAEVGKGAWVSRQGSELVAIHTSAATRGDLAAAIGLSSREDIPTLAAKGFPKAILTSGFGAGAMAVASGEAHLHVRASFAGNEWDLCAPDAILREAGGLLTDGEGRAFRYNKPVPHGRGAIIVAANEGVHAVALAEIVPALF